MAVDINDTPNRVRYTATAAQTAFSVPFQFLAAADLKLYQNGVLKTLSTHYTVTGAGASSGTLTLVSGAALSDDILIIRDMPVQRIGDFPVSGPFDVASLNDQLDAQIMMVRDIETRIDRRLLRQPVADLPETLSDIPAKAARANLYLGFDANGQPKADLPNAAVIADYGERIGDLETISGGLLAVGAVADNIASVTAVAAIDDKVVIAADNVADINNFADVYQGGKASNPTLRNDGTALQTGDLYFNTVNDRMRVYETGTGWIDYEATAQTAATTATTQAGTATTQASTATAQATIATSQATAATAAKTAAEVARDAAFVNANVYADTTAGLAAVALNEQFQVVSSAELIRYREDAGPVATEVARYPYAMSDARSLYDRNNFPDATGWNISGFDTQVFDGSGVLFTRVMASGGTSWTGRIFRNVGAVSLTAGRRYAFYADVELENQVGSSVATVGWFPFILSSTPGQAIPTKRITVGANGSPVRHRVVGSFVETVTGSKGNVYTDLSSAKDYGDQNMAAFAMNMRYRAFMMVDLGVASDPLFDLTDEEVAALLPSWGAPYHPRPGGLVSKALVAAKSAMSSFADSATIATNANLATMSETLRSPWQGKRLLAIGHSLVSLQAWQGSTVNYLSMQGHSFFGTAGGTVAPKPNEGWSGLYSRAYVASLITGAVNNATPPSNTTTNGLAAIGNTWDATILWAGANDGPGNAYLQLKINGQDRIMSIAEQDEFEAANAATPTRNLSTALSTGLIPTYKTLYMTGVRNIMEGLSLLGKPGHRFFMVREPQAFHKYDGTLDWPVGHWEKNLVHKEISDELGIPLIDLWADVGIGLHNRNWMFLTENSGNLFIHLSSHGGRLVGQHIARHLLRHPPIDMSDISGGSAGFITAYPTAIADLGPWNVDNLP